MRTPLFELSCIFGPLRFEVDPVNGKDVLTHLQKYSRAGLLITWPFCVHIWFFWRKQKMDDHGWIPGSEQGIYARTLGYRYDAELGMKFTRGYIGLHWD